MALSLIPAAGAAFMEPVDSIAVTGLVKPWVGDTPSTQVLGRRGTTLNKYTGTITVNGTAVTDAVYVADDGTISFNWWKTAEYGNDWDNSNTTIVVYNPKITQQP